MTRLYSSVEASAFLSAIGVHVTARRLAALILSGEMVATADGLRAYALRVHPPQRNDHGDRMYLVSSARARLAELGYPISKNWLRHYDTVGILPAVRTPGGMRLWSESQLVEFAATHVRATRKEEVS